MRGSRLAWIGRLLFLGLVANCATGGATAVAPPQEDEGIPTAIITVLNNAPGPRAILVYISSGSLSEDRADAQRAGLAWEDRLGIRLGSIDPGETGRFPFDFGRTSGRFRLHAVASAGTWFCNSDGCSHRVDHASPLDSSDVFELFRYSQATWNMSIRSVEVRATR